CANAILRDIYDQLVSIWEVRHIKYESPPNYIFLLANVKFHINMINRHWFNDKVYGNDLIIGLSKQEQELAQRQLKAKQRFAK
ncbi:7200_t:CDS:2, partial [Funneliformis geosporum]